VIPSHLLGVVVGEFLDAETSPGFSDVCVASVCDVASCPNRPTHGWAAITELAVVRLVAEGVTNREVAERLYISPTPSASTSATTSKSSHQLRVALSRLAAEHTG
jgi:hypothetical protein